MNMLFINQSLNRGLHTHYGHRFPQNGMDHHPLYIIFLITLTHDIPIRYQSYIQLIASRGICLEKKQWTFGYCDRYLKKIPIDMGYDRYRTRIWYIWNYSLDLSYHFSDTYNGHSHRFPHGGARRSCKRLWRRPRPRPRRPRRRSSGARRCRRPWRRPRRRGRRPRCGGPWGHGLGHGGILELVFFRKFSEEFEWNGTFDWWYFGGFSNFLNISWVGNHQSLVGDGRSGAVGMLYHDQCRPSLSVVPGANNNFGHRPNLCVFRSKTGMVISQVKKMMMI